MNQRSVRTVRCLALLLLLLALPHGALAKGPWVEGGSLAFSLTDLEGRPVSSADPRFQGNVVFLDLWGTWCPPCIGEIPTFVDLQARYGEDGLVVVGIAFERIDDAGERRAHLRDFVQEHGVGYLILDGGSTHDIGSALPAMREVKGFPIEVVIGRDGRVTDCRNGYAFSKKWARRLEREIQALLSDGADDPRAPRR